MKNLKTVVLCIILFGSRWTMAETIVLQPGSEGKDTYVCDCLPNVNNPNGSITHLYQGQYGACYDRILIRWNLSSLPKNISIASAVMELKCNTIYGLSSSSGQMVYYRITEDWEETKVTYATIPSHAHEDSVLTEWPAAGQWHAVDITGFAQKWIEDTTSNYGIYGHSVNTKGQCCVEFFSSDISTVSRPKLTVTYTGGSDVGQSKTSKPLHFDLGQNFPNPFNPVTTIHYSIPRSEIVVLKIYDLLGAEVATLIDQRQNPGNYDIQFDGSRTASGIYIYQLQAGNWCSVKKLILMK